MPDRRVTLVMTEAERDALLESLDAITGDVAGTDSSTPVDDERVARHIARLRAARVSQWGTRR